MSLLCAAVYVVSAGWMLVAGFRTNLTMLAWVGGVSVLGLVAFVVTTKVSLSPRAGRGQG